MQETIWNTQECCINIMLHSRREGGKERDGSCQCLALIMLYVCAERSSPNCSRQIVYLLSRSHRGWGYLWACDESWIKMNCSWKFFGERESLRKVLIGIRVNVQEVICGWQFVVFDQFAADCKGEVQHEVLGILNNRDR